jgi:predicted acyl esterase
MNKNAGTMLEPAFARGHVSHADILRGRRQLSPAKYDVTIEKNVLIEMSDGIALAADVYYPANSITGRRAPGTFPIILVLSPYSSKLRLHDETYLVRRGYIYVTVDVRGTKRSQGIYDVFSSRDSRDGVELVNWCAYQLDGSNGIVGMAGPSYLGFNQLLTARSIGPSSPLKAIVPGYAGAYFYREAFAKGGMPTIIASIVVGWMADSGPSATAYWQRMAANIGEGADSANEFWQSHDPIEWVPGIVQSGAAVLLWTGHSDLLIAGAQILYAALQNASAGRNVYEPMQPDQDISVRYQIVVGPYAHLEGVVTEPFLSIQLAWFDTWLKGMDTGATEFSTYHVYELSSKRWVSASDYPLASTYTTYYLNSTNLSACSATRSERIGFACLEPACY